MCSAPGPPATKEASAWDKAVEEQSESHHGIPKKLKDDPAVQDMRKDGFKYDGEDNRHDVPKRKEDGEVFHANHPRYTDQIRKFYREQRVKPKWQSAAPGELLNFGREFNKWLIGELKASFAQGIKINDITLDFSTFQPTLFK